MLLAFQTDDTTGLGEKNTTSSTAGRGRLAVRDGFLKTFGKKCVTHCKDVSVWTFTVALRVKTDLARVRFPHRSEMLACFFISYLIQPFLVLQ